jgi:2-dehydro-3-deoxyphosphogalactonate aldolase
VSLDLQTALAEIPLVAILRGLRPDEATSIGDALWQAGIRIIEVPLNSPAALESIRRLAHQLGESCLIGAGTVVTVEDVDRVVAAGGRLIVSPNTDGSVIRRTIAAGAIPLPGVATATEAYAAYASGARYLKLFPASTYGIGHLRALRAVLPPDARLLCVGGIAPRDVPEWMAAGACGIGMGSEIYRPGVSAATVLDKTRAAVSALHQGRRENEGVQR